MSVIVRSVAVEVDRAALLARAAPYSSRPSRLDTICLAGLIAAGELLDGVDDVPTSRHLLTLGTALGCAEADFEYYTQILGRGLRRTNPRIFAYTLPNVVMGEVSIAFGLTGDNLCFSAGRASGLCAIGEAHQAIACGAADVAIALCLDVVGPAAERLFGALGTTPTPIAAAFLLRRDGEGPRVTGFRSAFDPAAERSYPAVDPLGGGGITEILAGRSAEVRCPTGHIAALELS